MQRIIVGEKIRLCASTILDVHWKETSDDPSVQRESPLVVPHAASVGPESYGCDK